MNTQVEEDRDANNGTDGTDDKDNDNDDGNGRDNGPGDDDSRDEQDSTEVCEDREGDGEGGVDKLSDNLAYSYILNPWTGLQVLQCLTVLSCHLFVRVLQLPSNLLQHIQVLQPVSQLMQCLHRLQCLPQMMQ